MLVAPPLAYPGSRDQGVGEPAGLHHVWAGEPDLATCPCVVGLDASDSKYQALEKIGAGPAGCLG